MTEFQSRRELREAERQGLVPKPEQVFDLPTGSIRLPEANEILTRKRIREMERDGLLDPLTAFMCTMVTFVGTLIFIFSLGYMQEDENFKQFFCFLSLFAAAMLGLLYAALYGLLMSEDNALVLGAGLLFVVLAAIMVATRKVDWYQVGARIGTHSTPTSL